MAITLVMSIQEGLGGHNPSFSEVLYFMISFFQG